MGARSGGVQSSAPEWIAKTVPKIAACLTGRRTSSKVGDRYLFYYSISSWEDDLRHRFGDESDARPKRSPCKWTDQGMSWCKRTKVRRAMP